MGPALRGLELEILDYLQDSGLTYEVQRRAYAQGTEHIFSKPVTYFGMFTCYSKVASIKVSHSGIVEATSYNRQAHKLTMEVIGLEAVLLGYTGQQISLYDVERELEKVTSSFP